MKPFPIYTPLILFPTSPSSGTPTECHIMQTEYFEACLHTEGTLESTVRHIPQSKALKICKFRMTHHHPNRK